MLCSGFRRALAVAVRIHATGYLIGEITSILADFDVERSHGDVWNNINNLTYSLSDPLLVASSRVAIDETAVKIDYEWLFAAIHIETKLFLGIALFDQYA